MKIENEFRKACERFKVIEKRGSYYDFAIEIIDKYPVQACVIILAIWNRGRFNFVGDKEAFLDEFKSAYNQRRPLLDELKDEKFLNANFEQLQQPIRKLYSTFSRIKGVEYTGASKVLHLLNRELFVMWDAYINGHKPKKYYAQLSLPYKKYNQNADGYLEFLRDMQKKFKSITEGIDGRTIAKCIDEYNYITYTKPIQALEPRKNNFPSLK